MEDPSIVDFLESQGMPSDFASRRRLADQYGVQNYTGTAEQNTRLLGLLRGGTVSRVWATIKAALKLS